MKGSCLCGAVSFELSGELPPIYQCHCSLCRKVSGSSSNSALVIQAAKFRWLSAKQDTQSYTTDSGFKSEFCRLCGSPVPNLTANGQSYWVPAGLLSDPIDTQVAAHVYVDSHADWDVAFLNDGLSKYAEMPTKEQWLQLSK
ncbi:GFA family protein [Vibrio mexicanus]|uniref:GFA family protein n=1 Tax=Vibrio mexicanus TaxID=1004326 RepID=UPI00063CB1FC|nr:GFA family protein [Vibrio mexicanus]